MHCSCAGIRKQVCAIQPAFIPMLGIQHALYERFMWTSMHQRGYCNHLARSSDVV